MHREVLQSYDLFLRSLKFPGNKSPGSVQPPAAIPLKTILVKDNPSKHRRPFLLESQEKSSGTNIEVYYLVFQQT